MSQRDRDVLWRRFLKAVAAHDRVSQITLARRLWLIDYRIHP